ncbi:MULTISPECIES: sporulation protein YpjB [Thermoactinomyces]|uniref:sporulation protein YpjB n=1 Tax=Thermoactinomyces TaxID=2023 RepID=UPI0006737A9F|nr:MULTISPECIES: sporulation protein YpjB [Thermoactinomyces]MBH8582330.1 hypothetical protein [Thermoactinomyces sp. CICC 10735]QBK14234.1 hypothetical protein AB849_011860 [Thermoactinomyces vulgaris]
MRWIIWTLLMVLWIVPIERVQANEGFFDESQSWSGLANEVMKSIEEKDYLSAREKLTALSQKFSKSNWVDKQLTVPAIHMLSGVIMDVERNLNQIRPNHAEIHRSALRMQMAFDAVSHPHQPMWHQYYGEFKRDIGQIKNEIKAKNEKGYKQQIDQFYEHYQLIRPAVMISKSETTVQKLDSLMTWIRKTNDWAERQRGIRQWERLLDPLFFGSEKDVLSMVSPWDEKEVLLKIGGWISGLIAGVLAYVSWRRYPRTQKVTD